MRRHLLLSMLAGIATFALSCKGEAFGGGKRRAEDRPHVNVTLKRGQQTRRAGHAVPNPFTGGGYVSSVSTDSRCVSAELFGTADSVGRQPFVRFRNTCGTPIAVLTSPLEVRVRRDAQQTFPSEVTRTPYVLLYIYPESFGIAPSSFVGDKALFVCREPEYSVLRSDETRDIPVRGIDAINVRAGSYGVLMLIPIVRTNTAPARSAFDVRRSVETHNDGCSGRSLQLPHVSDRVVIQTQLVLH
jgi:hypothetical protein